MVTLLRFRTLPDPLARSVAVELPAPEYFVAAGNNADAPAVTITLSADSSSSLVAVNELPDPDTVTVTPDAFAIVWLTINVP